MTTIWESIFGGPPPTAGNLPGAAQQTQQASQQAVNTQTQANRPNQYNPFGANQWSVDANGNWTQNSSLTPGLQGTASALQNQAFANAMTGVGTGDQARNQAITGAYNQAVSRLNPQWAQQDQQLSSALANQGLDPNSQAYRNAMLAQSQAKNDAYTSAMNAAIGQGTAAQQATFNENLQAQQLPYQQMGALYGLLQPFGFNSAGQAQGANLLGATQAMDQQAYQAWAQGQADTAQEISAGEQAIGSAIGGGGGGGRGAPAPVGTPSGTNYFNGYSLGPTTYT